MIILICNKARSFLLVFHCQEEEVNIILIIPFYSARIISPTEYAIPKKRLF